MIDIGFMAPRERLTAGEGPLTEAERLRELRYCPRCNERALVFQEGCHTCRACGWSKCS